MRVYALGSFLVGYVMIYLGFTFISLMKFLGLTAFASLAHSTFSSSVGVSAGELAALRLRLIHPTGLATREDSISEVIPMYNGIVEDESTLQQYQDTWMLTLFTVLCGISFGDHGFDLGHPCQKIEDGKVETDATETLTKLIAHAHPEGKVDYAALFDEASIQSDNEKDFFEQLKKAFEETELAKYNPTPSELKQVSRAVFLKSWNTYTDGGEKLKVFPPQGLNASAKLPLAFLLNRFHGIFNEEKQTSLSYMGHPIFPDDKFSTNVLFEMCGAQGSNEPLKDHADKEMLQAWIGCPEYWEELQRK